VPLALGLPIFALVFTLANLALIAQRVAVENRALAWAAQAAPARPPTLANAGVRG